MFSFGENDTVEACGWCFKRETEESARKVMVAARRLRDARIRRRPWMSDDGADVGRLRVRGLV